MRAGDRVARWAVALVTVAFAMSWASTDAASAQAPPALTVTPGSGVPGDVVRFSGEGFPVACLGPVLTIAVTLDDVTVAQTATDADGRFVVDGAVPDLAAGPVDAVARCRTQGAGAVLGEAVATFEVLAGPPPPVDPSPQPSPRPSAEASPPAEATPEPTPRPTTRASTAPPVLRADPSPSPAASPREGLSTPAPADPGEPTAAPTEASVAQDPGDAPRTTNPDAWAASAAIPDIAQVEPDLGSAVAGMVAVALFVVLIGFPAVLFDGTFRRHYDVIVAGIRRRAPAVHAASQSLTDRFPRAPLVAAATIGGVLGLLLDPAISLDARTLWLLVGLAGVAGLSSWLGWVPTKLRSDGYGNPGRYRAYPAALFVALGCVVVSRAAGFNPGYLYGLLFAYHVSGRWSDRDDGAAMARGFGAVLVVGVVAWAALPLARTGPTAGGAALALEAFVAGMTLAGIEGVVLGMLPFTFAPGRRVWDWSRPVFAAIYVPAALAFWMLLSGPNRALLGLDGFPQPTPQAVAAFALYAALSLGFWQYWRVRARRDHAAEPEERALVGSQGPH